ncbi:MAG TPA: homocysteine S-methyltransferase [Porticoccaceae bacterium]|jgi:S-methylmethionine-dependent homocysteine/selenocysteine methylase|nr:homocysteine S-methyltransferase [Porticoccaceae bacterium]
MIQILDGGIGRYLKQIGAPFRQPEWSALALIEDPSSVTKAHHAFIDAGANIITTNSYAVVPFHIGDKRFLEQGAKLIALAGSLARQVQDENLADVTVAAGIPPVFGSYKPGEFRTEEAISRLKLFKKHLLPFTNIVLAETQSSIQEVITIQRVFANCGQPLWISMTLEDQTAEQSRLRSGESLVEALEAIDYEQVDTILFNCSQPEVMAAAVELSVTMLPATINVGVYANGFRPISNTIEANKGYSTIRDDLDPQAYMAFARQWQALGATVIGGCCGIGPEHIALLSQLNHTD